MGREVTLYCKETPGLKLGPGHTGDTGQSVPGEIIVFVDGFATFDFDDFPDWASWAYAPGTPYIRVAEGGESPDGEECPVCGDRFVNLNRHLKSHAPAKAAAAKKARTPAQIAATERMQAAAEAKRAQAGG